MKSLNSMYILQNGKPIRCDDIEQWGKWFRNFENRKVAHTEFPEKNIYVSTVFMAINHYTSSFSEDKPVLWETMIFNSKWESIYDYQKRYSSLEDAVEGHKYAWQYVMKQENLFHNSVKIKHSEKND